MTDQEIRTSILKAAYHAKKSGAILGIRLHEISKDLGERTEKIRPIAKDLIKKGLLKSRIAGKVVSTTDFEITTKGIKECEKGDRNSQNQAARRK